MTEPQQVLVNIADLEALSVWQRDGGTWVKAPTATISHLVAAIPEPEWEPTDDMLLRLGRAHASVEPTKGGITYLPDLAKAMHREALL